MPQTPLLLHLAAAVEQLTPLALAEQSWDNVGLLVEAPAPRSVVGRRALLCCIDLTPAVLTEALSNPSTSCILTYHPPIFSGLKRITLASPLQASLLHCIANGLSVFCIHTAADNALDGVNDFIAASFGTEVSVKAIKEKPGVTEAQTGAGSGRMVGFSAVGMGKAEVVARLKQKLGLRHLQAAWSPTGSDMISSAAICAGSGSSVLKDVQADLWITGELGHHEILAANAAGTHVLLTNHSASERPWLSSFAPRLQKAMNEQAGDGNAYQVLVSNADREPLEVV